jgi:hypothetical protein
MMRLLLMFALGILLTGTVAAAEEDMARLDSARALWDAAQSGDYRFRYQKYCDCNRDEPKVTVVTVSDGAVAAVHHLFAGSDRQVPAREGSLSEYWTMEDLFDKLAAAYASDAMVRVDYNEELGFPQALYIDYRPDLVGEEIDLRRIGFESR